VFRRTIDQTTVQFEFADTGQYITLTKSQVLAQLERKELRVVTAGPDSSTGQASAADRAQVYVDPMSLTAAERRLLDYRLAIVKALRKRGITKGQRALIAAHLPAIAMAVDPSLPPPKPSAVMQWARKYEASGLNPFVLAPARRGRRHRSVLSDFTVELVQRAIQRVYLTRDKHSVKDVHRHVVGMLARLRRQGQIPDLDNRRLTVSERTIYREIDKLDKFDVAVARHGMTRARAEFRYSQHTPVAMFPLQRAEVDHTLLNIYVIDDRLGIPLGRPWLTLVIDRFSSYILGFYVSFSGPSVQSALGAVKCAIKPKDELVAAVGGTTHAWLAEGIAALYVFDNGLEFQSPLFRAFVEHALRAEYLFCAVRRPWLKPSVERALHEINQALPRAGYVHPPAGWSDFDPRKHAAVTFSQLCRAIVRWVCDIYPLEMRKRTLTCPYDKFLDGLSFAPVPSFHTDLSQLDWVFGVRRSCTVGREGVQYQYLHYQSEELIEIFKRQGPSVRTVFSQNPENLGSIYVQDPRSQAWIHVPSTRPDYAEGLSLYQHREIRRFRRAKFDERHDPDALLEARMAYAEWLATISVKPRSRSATTAAKFANLTSAKVFAGETPTIAPPHQRILTREDFLMEGSSVPAFAVTRSSEGVE
jgi:putative transposase